MNPSTPKKSSKSFVISPQNESLDSIFGQNTGRHQQTPPPLREELPFFRSSHSSLQTPPPLDFEEGFPTDFTNDSLDSIFGQQTSSGLRTPPSVDIEKGFGFIPFEEPEWRKEPPKSNSNVPPLREEKHEQPVLPYEQQVAKGFSQRTGQIFLKLWRTAPEPARQQIRRLFSTNASEWLMEMRQYRY